MAGFTFILGIIGNIISMLVFSSPIGTFRRVVKKKSTENYEGIPYVTTLLSTSLWTFYGLLKPGGLLLVTVNGAGAALQSIYVTLFLIYAPKPTKVKYMKLVAILDVVFPGSVIAVTLLAIHGSFRLTFVGVVCAALTIGMYAAPLSAMKTVIKMKNVEYMPFFLSFFLFLNGGVWSVYSMLVKDYYVGVPNAVGFVLGSAQLTLYFLYKNNSSTKSKEEMEEEGSAHLMRRAVEMKGLHEDDDPRNKNRNLHKGGSLPKPTVSRQHSINTLMKTRSFSPYELNSASHIRNDIEDGGTTNKGRP